MRTVKLVVTTTLAAGMAMFVAPACTSGTGTTTGSVSSSSGGGGGSTSSTGGTCAHTGPTVSDPTVDATVPETNDVGAARVAPDVGCFETPVALGPSRMVSAHGCVDIFGVGSRVKPGMKLAIYGINQDPGPNKDTPMYGTHDIIQDAASGCDSEGRWAATGLPTNTPLIFKTYDTETGPNKTAVDAFQYNVVLRADRHDRDGDNDFELEANMIFVATYTSIPNVAGKTIEGQTNVSDGVGRAAVAGEVRDCSGNSWRSVAGATFGGSCMDRTSKIVYFDGQEDPKPDTTRTFTNADGLFAAVNVKASDTDNGGNIIKGYQQELEGKVRVGGRIISAGKATVWVYPDSVTIFSPQGLLPTTDMPMGSSSSSGGASSSSAAASSSSAAAASSSSAVASSSAAAASSSAAAASSSAAAASSSAAAASSSAAAASSGAAASASAASASASAGSSSTGG